MRQVVKFVIPFVLLVMFLANTMSTMDSYDLSNEDINLENEQFEGCEGKPEKIKEEQPSDPKASLIPPKYSDPQIPPEGYVEKWYSQEPGFNESLIVSIKRLTKGGIVRSSASFSPDGTKIIYSSKEDGGDYLDIWMMDIDGTNHTQLTTEDFNQYQVYFLSDGIHIVYLASHGEPGMNFHIKNLKDNTTKSIALHGMHPNVTPDNRIMVVSIPHSSPILMIDVNLENITHLPRNASGQWPDMSSDGTKIVFMKYNCNHYNQLSLYDVKNDTITQLTSEPINHNFPAISPDGKKIVYDTYLCNLYSNLWLYDVESGAQHQLTYGKVYDHTPEFSPDGKHLLFYSTRGNDGWSHDIWLLTLEKEDCIKF